MIVFDLTDEQSFRNVSKWLDQIKKHGDPSGPMVLVGNKADLTSKRVIDSQLGKELAKNLGIEYIETSAKSSQGVEQAFDKMLQAVVKAQNYIESGPKKDDRYSNSSSSLVVQGPKTPSGSTCNC